MKRYRRTLTPPGYLLLAGLFITGSVAAQEFELSGEIQTKKLDEASGLQAGDNGVFYSFNDSGGAWIYTLSADGAYLGRFRMPEARNKDWEDITRVPGPDGKLLVIGDIGDNNAGRKTVQLYFVPEPGPEEYRTDRDHVHRLKINYEDGPRDCESMAWDPSSDQLLFLTKRDKPPRLYGVPLQEALTEGEVEARFLGEVPGFRAPTRQDMLGSPKRGLWVSQPTGMDISADGRMAAVITYRSLYLFQREENETWAEAFAREPREFIGPDGLHDEAVAFDHEGRYVYVTTERLPAPIHRLEITD